MSENIVVVITAEDIDALARRLWAAATYGNYTLEELRRAATRAAEAIVAEFFEAKRNRAIEAALLRLFRMRWPQQTEGTVTVEVQNDGK